SDAGGPANPATGSDPGRRLRPDPAQRGIEPAADLLPQRARLAAAQVSWRRADSTGDSRRRDPHRDHYPAHGAQARYWRRSFATRARDPLEGDVRRALRAIGRAGRRVSGGIGPADRGRPASVHVAGSYARDLRREARQERGADRLGKTGGGAAAP